MGGYGAPIVAGGSQGGGSCGSRTGGLLGQPYWWSHVRGGPLLVMMTPCVSHFDVGGNKTYPSDVSPLFEHNHRFALGYI
jgi:hypothetical protein